MSGGIKFDGGKPRLDLISWPAIWEVAKVLGFGAQKYDSWNWIEGIEYSRLVAAVLRHVTAWTSGEDIDPESGISHLAHAMCGLMFLMTFKLQGRTGLDDRCTVSDDMYAMFNFDPSMVVDDDADEPGISGAEPDLIVSDEINHMMDKVVEQNSPLPASHFATGSYTQNGTCFTCEFYDLGWHEYPCNMCCNHHNNDRISPCYWLPKEDEHDAPCD